jgi:hypothetical protein
MKLVAALAFLVAISGYGAQSSDGVLRLTVTLHREPHPITTDGSTHRKSIRALLTNVSDKPVTVPTTTYDGGPCCWGGGTEDAWIGFVIGFRRIDGDREARPAPMRFLPVTLKPGESTELPEYDMGSDRREKVAVSFEVQSRYAKEQGWWSGTLSANNAPEETEPNQSPEPMPLKRHGSP